jgi:predicted permease
VFRQLEERISDLPDVVSAAAVRFSPFSGSGWNQNVYADHNSGRTNNKTAWFNSVSPSYFRTLQTPLLAGRHFEWHDDTAAPQVAIVNEKFARDLFGNDNPVGRTFRHEARAGKADPVYEIVGIVKDTKYSELREEARLIAFLPVAQDENSLDQLTFLIRARGPFSSVMAGVKQRMAEIDGGLLVEFRVLDLQIAQTVLRERLMANLSGGFGLLAAMLSTLGLYGVMSYMVARRRNEIGVRMAMGAKTRDILALVFGEAGRLVLIGLALGMAGSFALSRYAESLLFGLKPNDALSLALGCFLLAATGFAAALIPARRAARLDPATVLRDE